MTGETVRGLVHESGNDAPRGLLSDYSRVGTIVPLRTPMTPGASIPHPNEAMDTPQIEARNLRAMKRTKFLCLEEKISL
jgi:hypothetical protein